MSTPPSAAKKVFKEDTNTFKPIDSLAEKRLIIAIITHKFCQENRIYNPIVFPTADKK